jgi:Holliday junction resolvase RusA-like endonuclease
VARKSGASLIGVRFPRSSLTDYFDAMDVWERSVRLKIETPELLRTVDNRAQSGRQQRLLDDARSQVKTSMRTAKRRAFRGEVSVDLDIFVRNMPDPPSAPKSVKRYLDALQGLVYRDDRQVGHLVVRRFASDHPSRRGAEAAGVGRLVPEQSGKPCVVYVNALPLRLYVADFDRVFTRNRDARPLGDHRRASAFLDEDEPDDSFRSDLYDLYEERREEEAGKGFADSDVPGLADTMRRLRDQQIQEAESTLVLRQRPGPHDRPGPDLAAATRELFERAGMEPYTPLPPFEGPGTIWLPPLLTSARKTSEPSWADLARGHLEAHRAKWRILPDVFDRPLALDMAIHGAHATTHDIDNVGHTVLKAFEELYCGDHRGTVTSYRVYRQASDRAGIRVHLMTDDKLRQLDAAIEEGRDRVLDAGPDW